MSQGRGILLAMLVVTVTCLFGLAAVLVVLYREQPRPLAPARPWGLDGLPTPADIVRTDFPLARRGYDPAAVESHLDRVARAYSDLLGASPPEVVERLRRRAPPPAEDAGQAVAGAHPIDAGGPAGPAPSVLTGSDLTADEEALRAEAALDAVGDRPPGHR